MLPLGQLLTSPSFFPHVKIFLSDVSNSDPPFDYIVKGRPMGPPDMDEALAWGRKAVVACRAPVEVRAFLRMRLDTESLSNGDAQ